MAKWKELAVDMVEHPPHYNAAGIECIDAMQAMAENAPVSAHEAYCWQNSFKYLWRWPYKNGLEDLKKARWYLDRLISEVEKRMKPYDQGREAFIKGKLGNPYKIGTRPNKDWEFGFNTEYFKNLEKVKQYEQSRTGS